MPETSIVIKTEDRSSASFKTIAKEAAALKTKLRELQDQQHLLSKEKASINLDTKRAREELKKATDRFNETRDSADGLKMELAQASYDSFRRELDKVNSAAKDTAKQIEETERAVSKLDNSAESSKGGIFSVLKSSGIKSGLALGITDGSGPNKFCTRAQCAAMVKRAISGK